MNIRINNSYFANYTPYKLTFKGEDKEWNEFTGIEPEGEFVRDYIRRKGCTAPKESIYAYGWRLSEYDLNKLISYLMQKPIPVNNKILNDMGIWHLGQIEERSYRGAMVEHDWQVGQLEKAKIKRVIDLREYDQSLCDLCQKYGLEYYSISFKDSEPAFKTEEDIIKETLTLCTAKRLSPKETNDEIEQAVKTWYKNSREYIDNFTDFICTMQKQNVYIGCSCGAVRTNTALFFDYLFNPYMSHAKYIHGDEEIQKVKILIKNLYINLTEKDKLKMGWDKKFDEQFLEVLSAQ